MKILNKVFPQLEMTIHRWVYMWALIQRRMVLCIAMIFWLTILPISGSAAVISFTPSLLGGNQWKYDYTVAAAVADPTTDEFTIFFDPTRYANLVVTAAPLGWDALVIQPDAGIPADGFFDALALVVGIGTGTSLGGFAVSFDFLATGTPGVQRFDIVDPNTFASVSSGFTTAAVITPDPPTSNVPEPNTLALAGLALALLLDFRRQFPRKYRN